MQAADTLAAALKAAVACILPEVTPTPTCQGTTAADVSEECADELATLSFTPYSEVSIETRECIVREGYKLREVAIDLANSLGIPDVCHVYHVKNVFDYRCALRARTIGVSWCRCRCTKTGPQVYVLKQIAPEYSFH